LKFSGLTFSIAIGCAQVFAVGALAQSRGEADEAQSRAMPAPPATKEQKSRAEAKRKAEGTKQATSGVKGDSPESMTIVKTTAKEDKAAANAQRKAESAAAVKKGEKHPGKK
jgi:hypothetical protein